VFIGLNTLQMVDVLFLVICALLQLLSKQPMDRGMLLVAEDKLTSLSWSREPG